MSRGFQEFVLDQLYGIRGLRPKAMFGCVGLYSGDVFFGIVADLRAPARRVRLPAE